MSVYNTAPADLSKRGIRLSIRGGVAASLCFSVEKSGAINPFTTGRYGVVWYGDLVGTNSWEQHRVVHTRLQ